MALMEVPSVSLFAMYDMKMDRYVLTATVAQGSSKIEAKHMMTGEFFYETKMSENELIQAVLDTMANEIHNHAPWYDRSWLAQELAHSYIGVMKYHKGFHDFATGKKTDNGDSWEKLDKMYNAYWDEDGNPIPAVDANEPLADWEKELLYGKSLAPLPKDYVKDAPPKKGLSAMADGLPGMKTQIKPPCKCYGPNIKTQELKELIMHINDMHAPGSEHKVWSSDDLCDWLDKLHDTGVVNLEVQIPDKEIK